MTKVAVLGMFLLLSTTAMVYLRRFKKRQKRRWKTRPLNASRGLDGHFHRRVKLMRQLDHGEFVKFTRMSPDMFDHLLDLVKPHLQKDKTKGPISPAERLTVTLHFLAEGVSMQKIGTDFYMGKTTVHKIITETCAVLWEQLSPLYLPTPTKDNFMEIANGFYKRWNMPNCLGAIDGKHIDMQAPKLSGSTYFNYKQAHSIVLMAACDAFYRFTLVDVGAVGSQHDSCTFSKSGFGSAILERHHDRLNLPLSAALPKTNAVLPYFFVADQAFPLHDRIMRPYPGAHLGEQKNIFNYRLSRARRTIENTFGILTSRWRILRHAINTNVDNCENIVKACLGLHNFLQIKESEIPEHERKYCPTGFADFIDLEGHLRLGQWREDECRLRSVGRIGANRATRAAQNNRHILADFFVSDAGTVSWQYDTIYEGALPTNTR